jgi:hypothetical protein
VGSLYLSDLATGALTRKFVAHGHDVQACLSHDDEHGGVQKTNVR